MIQVSALKWAPPFAQRQVRDLRGRWALEEAGFSYEEMLVDADDQEFEADRATQPFGQVPIFEQDGLVLFETGAILLHVARRSGGSMPSGADAQARVTSWLFATLNSIEPFITNVVLAHIFHKGEDGAKQRRLSAVEKAEGQPRKLAVWLDGREWLEADRFTVADLLMTTVLRIPRHSISSRNMPSSTPICAVASPAPPSSTRWPHR